MAQINLLKQKTDNVEQASVFLGLFAKLLIAILIAALSYYVWLFFAVRSTDADITSVSRNISDIKSQALKNENRGELLARQQQLQQLDNLISAHPYWSSLLPSLAKVMLTKATLSNVKAENDGSIVLSTTLPSLEDLDKFLQVFDNAKFNQNFYDVKIGSFHLLPASGAPPATTGGARTGTEPESSTIVKVDVSMKFNPQILIYQNGAAPLGQ